MDAAAVVRRLETLTDAALRSRWVRYAGWVLGLAGLAFLARSLVQARDAGMGWFTAVTPSTLLLACAAFALYQAGSIVTLRLLYQRPVLTIWGISQLVKYLPLPGSAAVGMVGSAVRGGGSTRDGVTLTLRHTLVHVGAATAVGSPAVAATLGEVTPLPAWPVVVAGCLAGLGVILLGLRNLSLATAASVSVLTVVMWAGLGGLLWAGVALGAGDPVRVATAFAAAWVAGQIALPVPAGLGVREAVLLVLLAPVLGDVAALSFALGTRVLHVASDAVVAAWVGGRSGWGLLRRAATVAFRDEP